MKKLKLIYNPTSGDRKFKFSLDSVIETFQDGGYETGVLRCSDDMDLNAHFASMEPVDSIVCAGGDGTANLVLNAMMKNKLACPFGIIPSGTANDFASFIKMPAEPEEAAKALIEGRTIEADTGCVNGRHFLNVCGSGLFTNISFLVDKEAKDTLGKFAYYLKGLEQLPNFSPFRIAVQTRSKSFEGEVFLFLVLNGAGAGGFLNIRPQASITDGKFDFIAIKAQPVSQLAVLFLKLLKGDFCNDSGIISLKEPYFRIHAQSQPGEGKALETDIDGEKGPDMPIEVFCLPKRITLMVPPNYA
jgi:YegS/Rv2252/BmrU family lipid kinase